VPTASNLLIGIYKPQPRRKMKRKQKDIYKMTYEQLDKHIKNCQSQIIVNQSLLSEALSALGQIGFNINFEIEKSKELGVTPAPMWAI
jgi:hypothetical protein